MKNVIKATQKQIKEALTNKMPLNNAKDQALYEGIKGHEDQAVLNAKIKKSSDHFTASDWKKVYQEIQKIINL